MLDRLLARLNAEIDSWNTDLGQAVMSGRVAKEKAEGARLEPGSATAELVRSIERPRHFTMAVGNLMTTVDVKVVREMVTAVKEPTVVTKQLGFGAANAKGTIALKLIDLAHLAALAS